MCLLDFQGCRQPSQLPAAFSSSLEAPPFLQLSPQSPSWHILFLVQMAAGTETSPPQILGHSCAVLIVKEEKLGFHQSVEKVAVMTAVGIEEEVNLDCSLLSVPMLTLCLPLMAGRGNARSIPSVTSGGNSSSATGCRGRHKVCNCCLLHLPLSLSRLCHCCHFLQWLWTE